MQMSGLMQAKTFLVFIFAAGLFMAAGIALDRYGLIPAGGGENAQPPGLNTVSALDSISESAQPGYVCPMHSHIHSDHPGECPICGMDLVIAREASSGDADGDFPAVKISSDVVHNLGVRTAVVKRGTLARRINTMGMVSKIVATRNVDIKPGIPGRLESITEKDSGDIVQPGEVLYEVFSPERIRAQEEYLHEWDSENNAALPALWDALRKLKFTDVEIKKLEDTHEIQRLYPVVAPQTGAIIQRLGQPGDRVNPVSRVITLGGYYKVDANAEVFERQWSWLKFGQRAVMTVPSVPGEIFEGAVERVHQSVNFKTRSLSARLSFNTLNSWVKEGMVADITILALPRKDVLYIPRDALIQTGEGARVVVVHGDGRFKPVAVEAGIESGDHVEIIRGLSEGDKVVVSGQFLIDSESSLSASFRRAGGE